MTLDTPGGGCPLEEGGGSGDFAAEKATVEYDPAVARADVGIAVLAAAMALSAVTVPTTNALPGPIHVHHSRVRRAVSLPGCF